MNRPTAWRALIQSRAQSSHASRGLGRRAGVLACIVGLASLGASPAPAHAQIGVDEGESYDWGDDDGYAYESGRGSRTLGGAQSLEEARASGTGVRIGGGASVTLQQRSVPAAYTVRRGDTLWDITGHFYGNPWEWPRVWSYNPEITNPHWIYPDDRLRLLPDGSAGEGGGPASLPVASVRAARPADSQAGAVLLRDQGYLDEDALRTSGVIVGSPEEQMMLSVYDDVYIRFDDDGDVRPGMELTVFREMADDERGPNEEGTLVRVFGTVQLRSYDPERKMGRAIITEALDPIERGYRIANMPRRFEMVPAVPNQVRLDTEVIAALRPAQLQGDYQIVFVAVGREQSVVQGNRFFIVREGDEWRRNLTTSEAAAGAHAPGEGADDLPEEIVAEGRVVSVRPNSAALMITRSVAEVVVGDRAEMRQGY
jgi:hypothetical protein